MKKATERARYDAATGTVVVECIEPGGGTLDVQVSADAAEAIVQTFNEAKPEPPLGLDDSGVYRVSEFKLTPAVQPREKSELGVGRSALDQSAARVVANAAKHGCANARRANDGMWFASKRAQFSLKRV